MTDVAIIPAEATTLTTSDGATPAVAVAAYLRSLSAGPSRRAMASKLSACASILWPDADHSPAEGAEVPLSNAAVFGPWHQLTAAHLRALTAALGERYAPKTANVALTAVRGVLRSAWELRMLDRETLERTIRGAAGQAHSVKGSTLPKGRHIAAGELASLFRVASTDDNAARGSRDAALLALLYGGGLRRSEAVALDVADFDAEREAVKVRQGKGRKGRVVELAAGSATAVREWLAIRGDTEGPVLTAIRKGGRIEPEHRLSARAVGRILERLAEAAGVEPFTAHDCRRTWIGDLLEAGADIAHVQKLAGHSDPATTARYDRRPAEARRKAARLIAVPYAGRRVA